MHPLATNGVPVARPSQLLSCSSKDKEYYELGSVPELRAEVTVNEGRIRHVGVFPFLRNVRPGVELWVHKGGRNFKTLRESLCLARTGHGIQVANNIISNFLLFDN